MFDFFDTILETSPTTELYSFFMSLLRECQTYVQAHVIRESKTVMEDFQHDVWFMPLIVRDMINDAMDAKAWVYRKSCHWSVNPPVFPINPNTTPSIRNPTNPKANPMPALMIKIKTLLSIFGKWLPCTMVKNLNPV